MAGLFSNDNGVQQEERHTNDNIKEVACMCWFTAKGRSMPRFIYYKDEDGLIQKTELAEIMEVNKTNFAGIPATEYRCKIFLNGIKVEIKLIFYREEEKWEIHY